MDDVIEGFNKYFQRKDNTIITPVIPRDIPASNISGGQIGDYVIGLGNNQLKLDSKNRRITVNDGSRERIIIGRRPDGTYGIDVSMEDFDVNSAYEGDMLISSKQQDEWIELDPAKFSLDASDKLICPTYFSRLQFGDKLRFKDASGPDYQYHYIIPGYGVDSNAIGNFEPTLPISEIAYSRAINPSGFPYFMSFDSTLEAYDQNHTVSDQGTFTGTYTMIGNVVIATLIRSGFQVTGTPDYLIHETLPTYVNTVTAHIATGMGGDSVALASQDFPIGGKTNPAAGSAPPYDTLEIKKLPTSTWEVDSDSYLEITVIYKGASPLELV